MSDEISDDIILDEFAQERFYGTLIKIVSDSLHEELKSIGLCDKTIEYAFKEIAIDNGAMFMARAASVLMLPLYGISRKDGKPCCESFVDAQNKFLSHTYNVALSFANGKYERSIDNYTGNALDDIKSGFVNFKHVDENPTKYTMFLADTTNEALRKLHPDCSNIFDANLRLIKQKYAIGQT